MQIVRMKEYLENREFKVEMTYNPRGRVYEFRIIKSGCEVIDNFPCTPDTVDCEKLDNRQRDFLENLIGRWHRAKEMQFEEYRRQAVEAARMAAKRMLNSVYGTKGWRGPEIKNVIFNNPATIVFWKDGTKTVVKAENEEYDPEKGLAMAIAKKTLGNKHDYYNTFKKWLKKASKDEQ